MYTEIRRCLAIDYLDEFGPKSPTEHEWPLNEINSEGYQDHKKRLDKEQALNKQGYDRIKENSGLECQTGFPSGKHFKTSPQRPGVACEG